MCRISETIVNNWKYLDENPRLIKRTIKCLEELNNSETRSSGFPQRADLSERGEIINCFLTTLHVGMVLIDFSI